MAIRDIDVNRNPSCSRTMDPDMAFGSSSSPDIAMDLVVAQVAQIPMALVAAWPLDPNMVADGRSNAVHLQNPQ